LRLGALLVLALLLLGVLITRLIIKLTRPISDSSLALILEKRFPVQLQDKLITAVELADTERAQKLGYSEAMLKQTIEEASQRVGQLPLQDVFNWRRLSRKGTLLGLTIGGTLLMVFAMAALWNGLGSAAFASQFGDVATVWLERNFLLRNTPWPRQAHLELVDFPGDELRIGKDVAAPKVRARAYQYVVRDTNSVFGWRPLKWAEINTLLPTVKVVPVPGTTEVTTVDDVARMGRLPQETTEVLAKLDEAAKKRSFVRRFRKLDLPKEVTLDYAGTKSRGNLSLTPEANGDFTGEIQGLKESSRFTVRGLDFRTRPRLITLVPPPQFQRLTHTEYQPAYLSLRPAVNDPWTSLKGLRQRMPEKDLSLSGDKSLHAIRAGTELILRGTSDKPLKRVQ
ncbi:MAG: hypothetical protein ACRCZF_00840, partial [Gemmataceae bacterium]